MQNNNNCECTGIFVECDYDGILACEKCGNAKCAHCGAYENNGELYYAEGDYYCMSCMSNNNLSDSDDEYECTKVIPLDDTIMQIHELNTKRIQTIVEQRKRFLLLDEKWSHDFGIYPIKRLVDKLDKIFIGNTGRNFPDSTNMKIMDQLQERIIGKDNRMIIDVETDDSGYFDIANIVQISYYVCTESNDILKKYNFFVYNKDVTTDYYRKISPYTLIQYGVDPKKMYDKLYSDLQTCSCIVGHNVKGFDIHKLRKYFEKQCCKWDINKKIVDTMYDSRDHVRVRDINNKIKNPTLYELAQCLNIDFNFDKAHDALYDVDITFQCYKKLVDKKIIIILDENTMKTSMSDFFDLHDDIPVVRSKKSTAVFENDKILINNDHIALIAAIAKIDIHDSDTKWLVMKNTDKPSLLIFKLMDQSTYIINLKTLNPTKSSPIQTILSDDIKEKICKKPTLKKQSIMLKPTSFSKYA